MAKKNNISIILLVMVLVGLAGFVFFAYIPTTLTIDLETSQPGYLQIYYDTGQGYSEIQSKIIALQKAPATIYTINLPKAPIRSIRIDPMQTSGYFFIRNITYKSARGSHTWEGEALSSINVLQQVENITISNSGIVAQATGIDPAFELKDIPAIGEISLRSRLILTGVVAVFSSLFVVLIINMANTKCFYKYFNGDALSRAIIESAVYKKVAYLGYRQKSNKYKGFIRCFGLTAVLLIGTIALMNYVIDPFKIFASGFLPFDYQVNERVAKIRYLEGHHQMYNSYIFGSSRSASTNPKLLEKYLPESRFYNFSVSGGTPYDYLLHLKYFLTAGYEVKNIYLQLDNEALSDFKFDKSNYLNRHHPLVVNENPVGFYFNYLPIFPGEYLIGKVKVNFNCANDKIFDIEDSGRIIETKWEQMITAGHEQYLLSQPSFHQIIKTRTRQANQLANNMSALREIKQLCDAKGIKLIVFMSPPNHVTMDEIVLSDYLKLLENVAQIMSFWDFSGYNSVTCDDRHYYEKSHYRPYVGEWIAARIFSDKSIGVPVDFGHYITSENIQEHLQEIAQQFAKADDEKWGRH